MNAKNGLRGLLLKDFYCIWRYLKIYLLLMLVFSCGIGLILSSLSVYFRDVIHLYGVLTLAWMYITPIFYPISAVPAEVAAVIEFNPMYHYITFFRDLVLYGQMPQTVTVLACLAASALSFLIGFLLFRVLQRNFILYI